MPESPPAAVKTPVTARLVVVALVIVAFVAKRLVVVALVVVLFVMTASVAVRLVMVDVEIFAVAIVAVPETFNATVETTLVTIVVPSIVPPVMAGFRMAVL